jgi:hypothetical protein
MTTPAQPGPARPRRSREHRKWPVAALVAVLLHLALVLALSWMLPAAPVVAPSEPLFVSLRRPEIRDEPRPPPPAAADTPADRSGSRPARRRAQRRARPGSEAAAADLLPAGEPDAGAAEPAPEDLSGISVEPDPLMLFELAAQDPRIRRRVELDEAGPFHEPRGLELTNLPRGLKHREIKRLIKAAWKPDWHDIKDEAIAEVSGGWVKDGIVSWLGKWQEQLRQQQPQPIPSADQPVGTAPEERQPQELPPTFTIDFPTNPQKVVVIVDAEPLRDGGWAVSIAGPSGHPFFDERALEQIEGVANLFPEWSEGYGSAVRYRLEADFVIVPPSTSSLLGLSCAFPFCTPEELEELEVIHWFKKILATRVYFEGLLRAPEQDGETDGTSTDG